VNGVYLRFYTHENRKVRGVLFYEWLLDHARKLGIHGGSAFKAMAGFGRHGVVHEAKFFELAGDLTVEVEFIVTEEEATKLIELVREARLRVFYARVPAEFGVIEGEP
jgi:PII-like signaling protein